MYVKSGVVEGQGRYINLLRAMMGYALKVNVRLLVEVPYHLLIIFLFPIHSSDMIIGHFLEGSINGSESAHFAHHLCFTLNYGLTRYFSVGSHIPDDHDVEGS